MDWGKQDRLRGRAEQRGHTSESWPWLGPLATSRGWATAQNFSPPPSRSSPFSDWLQPSQEAPLLCARAEGPSHPRVVLEETANANNRNKAHRSCGRMFHTYKRDAGAPGKSLRMSTLPSYVKVNTLENLKSSFPEYSKERVTVTFIDSSQVNFLLAVNKPQYSGISTQLFT